jgi:excisionase family DNA binding protein
MGTIVPSREATVENDTSNTAQAALCPPRGSVARLRGRLTCSIDEAAELLGIGRSTAYAAARDGSLPTVRLSHRLLVPTAKLLAMLGEQEA